MTRLATPAPARRHARAGITLVELVAALALFVLIVGVLLTLLNHATSYWTPARSTGRETAAAETAADLLADDLSQAVTDDGTPSNAPYAAPTFVLDARTNQPPSQVLVALQFARHASTRSPAPAAACPLGLEAVLYTFWNNALFRHVIPLSYSDPDTPEPLGDLLAEARSRVDSASLHAAIAAHITDPAKHAAPDADWAYALLAERVDLFGLIAAFPRARVREPSSPTGQTTLAGRTIDTYDHAAADTLPDVVDLALRLHSEADWAALQRLTQTGTDLALAEIPFLGVKLSRRITPPARGGSRLP